MARIRKSCLLLVALAAVVDAAMASQVRASLSATVRVVRSVLNHAYVCACIVTLHTLQGCASPVARGLDNVMIVENPCTYVPSSSSLTRPMYPYASQMEVGVIDKTQRHLLQSE